MRAEAEPRLLLLGAVELAIVIASTAVAESSQLWQALENRREF